MARQRTSRPAIDAAGADAAAGDDGSGAAEVTTAREPAPAVEATPSMAQFLEIKAANPDSLLWYRMGDFYELFFEDAVVASKALSIVLTRRGKHLGQDIPMCGVPIHRADEYLQRLIRQGYRVAVCEQLEDPAEARKRGAKAVVRRDVVRLVTPGTLTEETLLDPLSRNFLTALFPAPEAIDGDGLAATGVVALASIDISTGEVEIGEVEGRDLPGELVRLAPGEIIAADEALAVGDIRRAIALSGAAAAPVPRPTFDSIEGERALKSRLGVADLGAFGTFSRAELAAAAAMLRYVELTQIGRQPVVRPPRRSGARNVLMIDASSRASLELMRATSGGREGSLLAAVDRTVTSPGARELAARLASPLRDVAQIEARLDAVQFLAEREAARGTLRAALEGAPDIARAISRLAFGRGSPRDLAAIRDGIAAATEAERLLREAAGAMGLPSDLDDATRALRGAPAALARDLATALVDEPPHLRRDGGFIRPGYRPELDEMVALRDASRRVIAGLEARYAEATGVKSLKIRHNNILGYFIEVTQGSARPLQVPPHDATFRHRQTMANAVRFSTPELAETEGRIAASAERALAIEQEIFAELAAAVAAAEPVLNRVADALAAIDVAAALAELAADEGYVRPSIDETTSLEIRGGRHPVVEQALRAAKVGPFIENDCVLGAAPAATGATPPGFEEMPTARIWLVTGPNMAGKSTFLRQTAVVAVLAQMGSFVPARQARVGLVDRLFSRVGASDDLARGRSTFMVEMVETAAILNQATERSLVILDEIGRGTATFDGLSIAWATVEHLAQVARCRALFATHYHEITALAGRLPDVANVTVDVKEWHDEIVFLHKVRPGAADRSYGIQVAKLAGLPAPVVKRAAEVLALLETGDRRGGTSRAALDDLPLFAAARPRGGLVGSDGGGDASPGSGTSGGGRIDRSDRPGADTPRRPSAIEARLADLDPDSLTPRAALDALYELKALAKAADGTGAPRRRK